jgi:hypothetical protein
MGTQRRTRVPVQLSNIHSTNCKRTTASELLAKHRYCTNNQTQILRLENLSAHAWLAG